MNEKIRLENDFYESVNGEWLEKAQIPADKSSISSFYEIHNQSEKDLMKETADLIAEKNISRKRIKDPVLLNYALFADMAYDFKTREKLGVSPILPTLKAISALKNKEQLIEKYKYFRFRDIALPFEFGIIQDFKNVEEQVLCISGPNLLLPEKSYYDDKHPAKELLISKFKEMSLKLLKFYYSDEQKNEKIIDQALAFDSSLVEFSPSAEENADYVKLYNPYSISDVVTFSKNADLKAIAENLVNKNSKSITNVVDKLIVFYPKFLENIDKVFNDENFENIKSWMFLKTIIQYSSLLNDESRVIAGEFDRALTGQDSPMTKEKHAFYIAYNKFKIPFGTYFAKKTFSEKAKANVEQMVTKMIGIYRDRLLKNDWLSKSTKEKAAVKLDALGVHIGYPKEIQPFYEQMKISNKFFKRNNLLKNALDCTVVKNTWEFNQYLKPINRNYWSMSPAEINAYYNPFMNHIVFPAGILNKPFYSIEQSEATNYGGIGAVIAHEISHAFDNNGAQFDEKGNLNLWWSSKDYKAFQEKAKDMITLFDNKTTEYGKCNGTLTVSENIADAGGFSCALEAAMSNDANDIKDFFTSFAVIWKSKYKPESARLLLATDVHAPAKLRANIQIQNSDEFYKAFNVKSSDKMWLPKNKRVKIW